MMFEQSAIAIQRQKPHCPQCEGVELRRHGRVGFWQRVVMPRFGLFPWECGLCRKIFFLSQRSTDYRQHATEYRQYAAEDGRSPLGFELVGAPAAPTAVTTIPVCEPVRRKQRAV